ncbi:hypothetical protein B6U99_02545 [Candidatus Geothermarchaeota archaeon ex4572_27]|nr:MAG: hypothetical protein B6U99_02545 [Candidatus Geothermarchaeota archaeon ex4572_27]
MGSGLVGERYDVVVVGGGPAGLSAAWAAARKGAKVLLVERNREIGVPIRCGEFLPASSEVPEILPRARHTRLLTSYPRDVELVRTKRVCLISPGGAEYAVGFDGVVVDRERFDKWLAVLAADAGAQIATMTEVVELGEGRVMLRGPWVRGWVACGAVVVAAGASSRITRELMGEPSPLDVSAVCQWVMGGAEGGDTVYMVCGTRYAPGAYGWLIPRGRGQANVGTGLRRPYAGGGAREYLEKMAWEHPVISRMLPRRCVLSEVGGLVPVGPPPPKTAFGNVLVVGDAANMVVACLGAGVPTAVIGGCIAGECAAEVAVGGPAEAYERAWREEFGDVLERGYEIRRLMDPVLRRDWLMELALDLLGEKYLSDVIRVRLPRAVKFLYESIRLFKKAGG